MTFDRAQRIAEHEAVLVSLYELRDWLMPKIREREELLGRSPSGSGQSGLRPEPASRLGHSETVPNADEVISKANRIRRTAAWLGKKYPGEAALDGIFVLALGITNTICGSAGRRTRRGRA